MHLWVDPLYGDDSGFPGTGIGAGYENPPGPAALSCDPSHINPQDVLDGNGAVLLHAPWPFKTVTGALAWLRAKFGPSPLPASSPTTNYVWQYAVIHLLPGIYASEEVLDLDNGLMPNGESFPIHLPDNVSVKGTSALNTIFDVEDVGPAFEFGNVILATGEEISGANVFIDSVSIIGGRHFEITDPPEQNAAIFLNDDVASKPTITNCFIYQNFVGIMVSASTDPTPVTHLPVIVNNTIAWNRIGLWNGQHSLPPTATGIGLSKLILLNNVFDPGPPFGFAPVSHCSFPARWIQRGGASAFEGIAAADMAVAGVDYNAYPHQHGSPPTSWFDTGVQILANLSATVPAGAAPTAPDPSRDITGLVGDPTTMRGTLYVRDVLCNGDLKVGFTSSASWDQSPHDFRLSPAVADAVGGAIPNDPGDPAQSGMLNPLVDNGWSSVPVTLDNGRTLSHPPGALLLEADGETWQFDSWDHDGEGYGNPRIVDHPAYSNGPGGAIDIGADELGILVVAGYRTGTTLFLRTDDPSVGERDNSYQWFLGPPESLAGPPDTTALPHHRWIQHLALLPSYDFGGAVSLTWWSSPTDGWPWSFAPPTQTSPPYYRPSLADITPHLLIDPHPWWHQSSTTQQFAANPIWQPCLTSHNESLYIDPLANVANPPGTYRPPHGTPRFEWLDESGSVQPVPTLEFGSKGTGTRDYGGPIAIQGYDAWCRGFEVDAQMVTHLRNDFPATYPAQGDPVCVRFSVEFEDTAPHWGTDPSIRNVQSFGIVVEAP